MKILPFKIPKTTASSIRVQIDQQPYFYDTLHQHPEIQITLIMEGTGTLFLGEYIGEYVPGNVFVIGTNVPHVLKSDVVHYADEGCLSHAVSIFFDEDSLGKGFFQLPELNATNNLLQQARKGIQLNGKCKEEVGRLIKSMTTKQGIDKVITLLHILKSITASYDNNYLSEGLLYEPIDEADGVRLNTIFQFTLNEHASTIKLKDVANRANMTVPAFCRYFKQRTRKTYVNFLNEIRLAQACKLLLKQDTNISQVAYQCGFGNLSYFNRVFKKAQGITPREYRKSRASLYHGDY